MIDEPWTPGRLYALVYGKTLLDPESMDGLRDDEGVSYYQKRCAAIDKGRPEMVLDAIQMERAVDMLPEPIMRAAVTLVLMGWDEAEISAVLTHRRNGRTINRLVKQGIREIVAEEQRRGELR
jgi:hypothetical protein